MIEKQEESDIMVRRTGPFKLKDRGTRHYQGVNLMKQFGFLPEVVIIQKEQGRNNTFRLLAVLTEKEKKLERKRIKNLEAVQPHEITDKPKLRAKKNGGT